MAINVASSIVDNHAMPTCSIAASGSAAKSSRGKIASASDGISGVCSVAERVGVERAPVRICGVCSVARHVRLERFLELLSWSNGLFLIDSIARSTAESSRGKIASALDGISGVCSAAARVGVELAPVGICGVCSVARHVRVECFLELFSWSNGLFPIDSIARNAARTDVNKPKELASANHAKASKKHVR